MKAVIYPWATGYQVSLVGSSSVFTRLGIMVSESELEKLIDDLSAGEHVIAIENVAVHVDDETRESILKEGEWAMRIRDMMRTKEAEIAKAACDYAYGSSVEELGFELHPVHPTREGA